MSIFENPKILCWEVIRRQGGSVSTDEQAKDIADRFLAIGFLLTEEDRKGIKDFIGIFNDSSPRRPGEFSKVTEAEPWRGGIRLLVIEDAVVMETKIESDSRFTNQDQVDAEWKRLNEERKKKIASLKSPEWIECKGIHWLINHEKGDRIIFEPGLVKYWMPKKEAGTGSLEDTSYKNTWLFYYRMLQYLKECNEIRKTWPADLSQDEVPDARLEQLRSITEENSKALKERQDSLLDLKELQVKLKVVIGNLEKVIKPDEKDALLKSVRKDIEPYIKQSRSKLEGQIQFDLEQYQNKVERLRTRGEALNASVQLAEARAAENLNRIAVSLGFAGVLLAFAQIHPEWFAWDMPSSWLLYSVVLALLWRAWAAAGFRDWLAAQGKRRHRKSVVPGKAGISPRRSS